MADERRRASDRLEDEVLGINDGPVNRREDDMPFRHDEHESAENRRRRADDLKEGRGDPGGGPDGPDGMKVQI